MGLAQVPEALSGAQNVLQRLDLSCNDGLQLAPRCFCSLGMLAELSLSDCGLTAVPAALSGVQDTLRRLDLSLNPELQINRAGFDTLVTLPSLEWVCFCKARSGYRGWFERESEPRWTDDSIRSLAHFHLEWQRLHPRAQPPSILVLYGCLSIRVTDTSRIDF